MDDGKVEVRLQVQVDWEEEREVMVWDGDWDSEPKEVVESSLVAAGGMEEVVEGVERLEVKKTDLKKGEKGGSTGEGVVKNRKRPRRRGGKGSGQAQSRPSSDPSSLPPAPNPLRNRLPPPSSATPRPPRAVAAAATAIATLPLPPTPRSSSVLTLSLTKTGVATAEGHKLVHLTPSQPSPTTVDLPPTSTAEKKELGPKKLSLRYMPPLELVIRLGDGYPEKEAPSVSVLDSVGWLGGERLEKLEKMLGDGSFCFDFLLLLLPELISLSFLFTLTAQQFGNPARNVYG